MYSGNCKGGLSLQVLYQYYRRWVCRNQSFSHFQIGGVKSKFRRISQSQGFSKHFHFHSVKSKFRGWWWSDFKRFSWTHGFSQNFQFQGCNVKIPREWSFLQSKKLVPLCYFMILQGSCIWCNIMC